MSVVSRLFRTVLVATCFMAMQPAAYAASGWYFNPQGSGAADASFVSALNVGGFGFIQQTLSTSQFLAMDFKEHGAYQVLDAAGSGPFGARDITVSYDVGGYLGLFGSDFTHGTIDIYSDPVFDFGSTDGTFGADNGTRIARFDVLTGSINPLTRQALVQADLVSGSMASGYFFDSNGVDISARDGVSLSLGVHNSVFDPSGTNVIPEIACEQAGFTGRGCNGRPYRPAFFDLAYSTVEDVGYVTLDIPMLGVPAVISAVPEPATALMMLTGLAGIGAWRRLRTH